MSASPYLTVEQLAEFLHVSRRSIHELTRQGRIPLRRVAGTRRILFLESEIREWLDGALLEVVVDDEDGAKVVRPRSSP